MLPKLVKVSEKRFNEYNNFVKDANAIIKKAMTTRSQEKIVKILLLLTEIVKPKDEQPDKQSDAANMFELESEKSAEQRRNQ